MSTAPTRGRYDAFISYSHSADRELARNLQRALERIASPWYRARSLRAFRDETDLTADPKLWPILTAALESADYFVLLASPGAASSKWVSKEIDYWLDGLKRPADTVLIAVTDGEIAWDAAAADFDPQRTTCIPHALRKRFAQEPLAADFRDIESRKLGDPDFTQQAAKLVAAIRKLPLRELYDLEMTRYRRRLRLIGATAVVLAALLAIVGWQLVRIQTQSRDALAEALSSRSRVEQTSAPARATMLAATAVALRDSPRTRAQWIAAAYGLAAWTAVLPGARLLELDDGEFVVGDASNAPRRVPLPEGIGIALPVSTTGLHVVDEGQCIAPDYVTPAPQGGDVPVCNASELGFGLPNADAVRELWITVEGGVRALRAPSSCEAIPLLRQNPIRGDFEVGSIDATFLREHAHATARIEDDEYETVEPPSGWVPVGMLDRPGATSRCSILFLDETRQLRRFSRTGGEALVSDSSYGPIEDFRVSPDGRWIAIQHAGGRFVVRRAETSSEPRHAVRWASALRREDGSYQGIALTGGDGTGPICLTSPGAEPCDVPLQRSPGVLGGFGDVFVDTSRTGVEQIVASNFPGFVVCRPDGVSAKCGEVFGIERSAARAVAISADATRAAVAQSLDVKLFDLPVERKSSQRRSLSFVATRLAFDGARLWLGGPSGLRVLDGDTDAAEVDGGRVEQLAVLAGGNRVVLEDGGGQLRLAAIGAGVVGLGSLPQPATALAAAASETLIALGQPDGNLIFWDLERRSESARVALGGAVRSAAFRSDGRELWVATASGVAVLSTDPEELLRRTCEAVRFSDADWRQVVDRPPPVDPCVPRGWPERVLAFARLE